MPEVELHTRGRFVNAAQLNRLEAADKFVSFLHFMIQLGSFETISLGETNGRETREWFFDHLAPWEDLVYPEDD